MTQPDAALELIDLAAELGLQTDKPVDNIIAHCRSRIDGWVAKAGGVTGIEALESLVTRRLQMVFEEIRSDEDFDRLTQVYAREKKEFVFGAMLPTVTVPEAIPLDFHSCPPWVPSLASKYKSPLYGVSPKGEELANPGAISITWRVPPPDPSD